MVIKIWKLLTKELHLQVYTKYSIMTFEQLYQISLRPANLVLPILLGLSVLYWIFTIMSGVSGLWDLDVDIDVDSADVDMSGDPSSVLQFLKYLNLDIIPITFFLTLTLLFTWAINVNLQYFLGLTGWVTFATIIPAFIVSMHITRFITLPFKNFFKEFNYKGEEPHDFIGMTALLKTSVSDQKLGMIELVIDRNPIKLVVKSLNGHKISENNMVKIVEQSRDKKYYYVIQKI